MTTPQTKTPGEILEEEWSKRNGLPIDWHCMSASDNGSKEHAATAVIKDFCERVNRRKDQILEESTSCSDFTDKEALALKQAFEELTPK